MGNKAPNVKKHQMMELNRAIDSKTTTKIVALLKQYGLENGDVAKVGCQHLFYALQREGEAKKEADLDTFRKGEFAKTLVEIVKNYEKASEASGWALSIVSELSKHARTERKYENFTQELIDNGVCEAIHNAHLNSKDPFVLENCESSKANIRKLETGAEAFDKLK